MEWIRIVSWNWNRRKFIPPIKCKVMSLTSQMSGRDNSTMRILIHVTITQNIRYDSYVLVLCYIISDTRVTAPNVMLVADLMWLISYSNPVGHGHIAIFQKSGSKKSF